MFAVAGDCEDAFLDIFCDEMLAGEGDEDKVLPVGYAVCRPFCRPFKLWRPF